MLHLGDAILALSTKDLGVRLPHGLSALYFPLARKEDAQSEEQIDVRILRRGVILLIVISIIIVIIIIIIIIIFGISALLLSLMSDDLKIDYLGTNYQHLTLS